jgi:hypothetical protein
MVLYQSLYDMELEETGNCVSVVVRRRDSLQKTDSAFVRRVSSVLRDCSQYRAGLFHVSSTPQFLPHITHNKHVESGETT